VNPHKTSGVLLGLLFLIAMATSAIGGFLFNPLINSEDFLTAIDAHSYLIILGFLLEFICAVAVIGIGVSAFPFLKKYNETLAHWYTSVRIFEATLTAIFVIAGLLLVTVSHEYVKSGTPESSYYHSMGVLLKGARFYGYRLYFIAVCSAAPVFYYVFYKLHYVPRFITVWGLIGTVILLIGNIAAMLGLNIQEENYAFVLGLDEIFIGFWLVLKGVNVKQIE
jgi:hypothetical protein